MRHATPRRIQWSAWMADGMAMSMTKLVLCPVVHNVGEGATKIEESERESVRAREKDLQKLVPYYIYYVQITLQNLCLSSTTFPCAQMSCRWGCKCPV